MSTVQEIRLAITSLPASERQGLIDWLHAQEEAGLDVHDSELLAQAQRGASEIDSGEGISMEEARRLTSRWTSK